MSDSPIATSVQYSILGSDNIVLKKLHTILHDVGLIYKGRGILKPIPVFVWNKSFIVIYYGEHISFEACVLYFFLNNHI